MMISNGTSTPAATFPLELLECCSPKLLTVSMPEVTLPLSLSLLVAVKMGAAGKSLRKGGEPLGTILS